MHDPDCLLCIQSVISPLHKFLLVNPTVNIELSGHTDSDGDKTYNQSLSEKRADAISGILISKYNVPSSQLETIGYGETKPLGDNSSAQGKAKNRRVELIRL